MTQQVLNAPEFNGTLLPALKGEMTFEQAQQYLIDISDNIHGLAFTNPDDGEPHFLLEPRRLDGDGWTDAEVVAAEETVLDTMDFLLNILSAREFTPEQQARATYSLYHLISLSLTERGGIFVEPDANFKSRVQSVVADLLGSRLDIPKDRISAVYLSLLDCTDEEIASGANLSFYVTQLLRYIKKAQGEGKISLEMKYHLLLREYWVWFAASYFDLEAFAGVTDGYRSRI